jgi:hypothetical protein
MARNVPSRFVGHVAAVIAGHSPSDKVRQALVRREPGLPQIS